MKSGRLTQEERANRIRELLGFIFIFRYATRKQLDMFIKSTIGLSFPHRIIEASLSEGYIRHYYKPLCKCNIYYLTVAGKVLLYDYEAFIEYYKFERRHTGLNTFDHHNLLVEIFFLLKKHLEIKKWVSEWVLRVDRKRWEKLPDGQITLPSGLRIALEAETGYKDYSAWKDVIYRYRHDIERNTRYHAVLVIAVSQPYLEGIIIRLFNFAPEFCGKRFIFTDLEMLKTGECFYQNEVRTLQEAVSLLDKEPKGNEKGI